MKLSDLIYSYRKKNGLSMEAFGKLAKMSKQNVSLLEKGISRSSGRPVVPTLETLNNIAIAMGKTIDELLAMIDDTALVTINVMSRDEQGYYTDPEVAEYAEELRTNPKYRLLFDASKDLSKEDIDFVVDMIERLKAREGK